MKKSYLFLLILILIPLSNLFSQNIFKTYGGEYIINQEKKPCITNIQHEEIKIKLKKNIKELRLKNKFVSTTSKNTQQVFFNWPVQQASGFTFNDVWGITNYVDHNTSYPNQITDYNCGSKSYDTSGGYNHQGVDIFLWPFSWYMVDNNQAEVIAAQEGQIIEKIDGNYDRNCSFNSSEWNAIYVRHNDGSTALYGHMKNGSLTTKNIGDMVTQGEYLGIVASSGNSTGPHLHFEVLDNDYNVIDPYYGDCNNLNNSSWWDTQKPYLNTNINAILTHTAPPVFNGCPTTETTNISDNFTINDTVYFAIYLRDQLANTNINLKIIKPDNSVYDNWNFTFNDNYTLSYWYWGGVNVDAIGVWKWEATYEGQTIVHPFNVSSSPLNTNEIAIDNINIYPNPANNFIKINSKIEIDNITISNILGKKIIKTKNINKIDISNIAAGIYFLKVETNLHQNKILKFIKK